MGNSPWVVFFPKIPATSNLFWFRMVNLSLISWIFFSCTTWYILCIIICIYTSDCTWSISMQLWNNTLIESQSLFRCAHRHDATYKNSAQFLFTFNIHMIDCQIIVLNNFINFFKDWLHSTSNNTIISDVIITILDTKTFTLKSGIQFYVGTEIS